MHENGLIHAKLGLERFLIGNVPDDDTLYLVSFDKTLIHGSAYNRTTASPLASYEFMSLGAHRGQVLSWKDDLESLVYILVYFLKGRLPWSDTIEHQIKTFKGSGLTDLVNQIVYRSKLENSIEKICENLPSELKSRDKRAVDVLQRTERIFEAGLRRYKKEVQSAVLCAL